MTDFKSPQPCTRCKGSGTRADYRDPTKTLPCFRCEGRGSFPGLDIPALVAHITAGKGDAKRFRKSWPSKLNPWRSKDVSVRRAYYVWRLARFHGGADVTLPMTAMTVIEGDPMAKVLDQLSDIVAKKVFGSDRAAAARWGGLLGFSNAQNEPGLPAAAYAGGPVVTDGFKPDFEALELG